MAGRSWNWESFELRRNCMETKTQLEKSGGD